MESNTEKPKKNCELCLKSTNKSSSYMKTVTGIKIYYMAFYVRSLDSKWWLTLEVKIEQVLLKAIFNILAEESMLPSTEESYYHNFGKTILFGDLPEWYLPMMLEYNLNSKK